MHAMPWRGTYQIAPILDTRNTECTNGVLCHQENKDSAIFCSFGSTDGDASRGVMGGK